MDRQPNSNAQIETAYVLISRKSLSSGITDTPLTIYLSGSALQIKAFKEDNYEIPYPFKTQILTNPVDTLAYVDTYPTFSILGRSFDNVTRIIFPNSKYNDRYYLSDSIGIVKMRIQHPQDSLYHVWEIERWKDVK